ncbi:Retrovirus-related Pol polyprotein from transposon TNT 1-94 [Vitis vinifera]|uniref:Retrovirus-related Pol polyprotein from transposon TNT 1-94 n=1 Tax=Vitis vinifera TaxID=29760 RepID=A0A438H472_VITVI|nr:Retrovirus-related Pol polyprotein from transposon TNT 1-94 [Vitis vinifera]
MDIDYAIRKDEPHKITDTSTPEQILLYERWEKYNRLSVMYIKTKISAGIRGSIEQHENVRELLKAIDEQFVTSDKALASTLIMKFTSLKLTAIRGVREHIMEMRDIVAQLKKLEGMQNLRKPVTKTSFSLICKSECVGNGILSDGLYCIFLQNDTANNSLHVQTGIKRCVVKEDSSTLWHRRLGHISIDRIKRLVNDGVLSTLDFNDFETCGTALRKYFISFIDDFSRYMYLYILHNKNEVVDAFKVFKAEVEKQYGKQIKIVRSNRGGEYYGRYLEYGQSLGPFAKFLQEHGIVAQYTMSGSPDQNGVAERRNRTLLDMVRSWKPSLRHIRVWGCSSEVRIYNPQEKKLDPRTISGYFIGYAEKSKGYRFYCPSYSTRIVESRNAKFLEYDLVSESDQFRNIVSDIDHTESQPSTSSDRLFIVHNTPQVQTGVERTIDEVQPVIEVPQVVDNIPIDQVDQELPNTSEQQVEPHTSSEDIGATLRRSARTKRSAIPSDYVVYLQESDYNIGAENDPESFSQAMSCKESELWYNAMKDEMSSMKCNDVWDLVKLPNGAKTIGCKWVFKTKKDSLGNIERYKARLVAKGFTQNEGIDYTETFSPVSKKDSLRIILALVAHFDLELQQMDVKTAFLNGELEEEVYMKQPEGFLSSDGLHRPDIAFSVGILGRYQSNPDSDFAGCVDSRESTSGYIFILAGGAISWRSVKQTMTATSTMEVEFISCFEATSHGVWLKSFISGLRVMDSISRPLSIYCDNSAAVFMAKNNKSGSRSKHIDIKYLAIRERVKEKKVVIEHISTELMIADPLTKGMPPLKFKDHVMNMGLSSFM